MKIWFNYYHPYQEDVKLGLDWYLHKRKEWKGFTISIILYKRCLDINIVSNYKEYNRIVNRKPRAIK